MKETIRFSSVTIILILISTTCSFINQESADYYRKTKMRHWIVPLNTTIEEKVSSVSRMRGELLYQKHCLSCHGKNGLGDGPLAKNQKRPPTNLKELSRKVDHFKFYMVVSELEGKMPGWKEPFNEQETEDLSTYIKTLK